MKRNTTQKHNPSQTSERSPAPPVNMPAVPGFDVGTFAAANKPLASKLQNVARLSARQAEILRPLSPDAKLGSSLPPELVQDAQEVSATLTGELEQLAEELKGLQSRISDWRLAERSSRRTRFEEASRLRGWKLAGNWPEPVVEGIVFIVVNEQEKYATVNGKRLRGEPAADTLISAVEIELDSLTQNRAEPAAFISALWNAFRACGAEPGKGIEIYRLLREMLWQQQTRAFHRDPRREIFRPYPVSEFRANLTHCLATGQGQIKIGSDTFRLEIVGGSFAQDSIFMYFPQTDRLASCGRIDFQTTTL